MTLKPFGEKRKKIRVLDVTKKGVTFEIKGKPYTMAFKDFPWLESLTARELGEFYLIYEDKDPEIIQPDLEIELGLEVLENPKKFRNVMDPVLRELQTLPRDTNFVQAYRESRKESPLPKRGKFAIKPDILSIIGASIGALTQTTANILTAPFIRTWDTEFSNEIKSEQLEELIKITRENNRIMNDTVIHILYTLLEKESSGKYGFIKSASDVESEEGKAVKRM